MLNQLFAQGRPLKQKWLEGSVLKLTRRMCLGVGLANPAPQPCFPPVLLCVSWHLEIHGQFHLGVWARLISNAAGIGSFSGQN